MVRKIEALIALLCVSAIMHCEKTEASGKLKIQFATGGTAAKALVTARVYLNSVLVGALPSGSVYDSSATQKAEFYLEESDGNGNGNGTHLKLTSNTYTLIISADDDNDGEIIQTNNWLSGKKIHREDFTYTGQEEKTVTVESSGFSTGVAQVVSFQSGLTAASGKKARCFWFYSKPSSFTDKTLFLGISEMKTLSLDSSGNGTSDNYFRLPSGSLYGWCLLDLDSSGTRSSGDYEALISSLTASTSTHTLSAFTLIN